jgi:hypothetical protein
MSLSHEAPALLQAPCVIVVIVRHHPDSELVRRLIRLTGKSVGEVQRALRDGTSLVSERLWFNDHDERAAVLRALVAVIEE